jgi:FkbM family methyltransferase
MLRATLKKLIYGKLPIVSGRFPYFGEKVFFPRNSFMFELVCKQGVYEKTNVDILLTLARPDTYYFDVGANIGLMSLPVLWHVPTCQVVSIEPSPATAPFLERTAAASSFASRWTVVTDALGSTSGSVDFHAATAGMDAFDGFYDTGRSGVPSAVVKVPMTTLDRVWDGLGRPPVSILKIDVEGAELEVLQGGETCIAAEKPFVLLEWNAGNADAAGRTSADLLNAARDLDYGVYSLPHMTPVSSTAELSAQMLFSEDFLLVPIRDTPWPTLR